MSEVMTMTHTATMNLRFVRRFVSDEKVALILQQMFVPKNWNTHEEFWQDVPIGEET